MNNWLKRKKASLCVLAGLCAVSIFIIISSNGKITDTNNSSYMIKIRHYGIDLKEIERTITIPLEDALSAIPGVMSVQSSSENGISSVYIRFKRGDFAFSKRTSSKRGRYEAVRDAAQRVYETLPPSVQRPEIISSNNSRVPVWSCAVIAKDEYSAHPKPDAYLAQNTNEILNKTVKPRLESLEGAGEVLISGVGSKQIYIILDQEKLAVLELEAETVASFLGMNDSVFSGGSILQNDRRIIVTVDGRYSGIEGGLGNVLIPLPEGKVVRLSDIAVVTENEREPDILSRLNGQKTAGIAVMGKHGADLRKLSANIKKELAAIDLPFEIIVLSDLGAEEANALKSVLNAALAGSVMVALICFLLNRNLLRGISCALTIPVICLVSAAFLSVCGINVDRLMLAGIAAGVGTAVDAVILSSEKFRFLQSGIICSKKDDYFFRAAASLKELAYPLTAGAVTTVAALLPLIRIEDGGVKVIAISVAVVCVTALVISLSLLPPLLINAQFTIHNAQFNICNAHFIKQKFFKFDKLCKQIKRKMSRLLAINVRFCLRYPLIVLGAGVIITAAAVSALLFKGVDTGSYGSENSCYAQVEFDGGLLPEEVDRLLALYSLRLMEHPGIKNVETGARTGSGSLLISFDPKATKARFVRDLAKNTPIQGGFVFFHENSINERYWEIKIYGSEDQKCRELAEELAYLCAGLESANKLNIRERILNFKQGSKKLILTPDRDIFAAAGLAFSNAAGKARTGVYGPVAYKRIGNIQNEGEIDVRIYTGNFNGSVTRQSREEALGLLVSGMYIDSLMQKKEETEPSSIRRDDRRRCASITITTDSMDPRRVKKELLSVFNKLDLPPGYSVEFDPEAIEQAKRLSHTVLSFFMAVLFCYMVLASINESFTIPFIVLAAIPVSLSIPALILALTGSSYSLAIACAFIAVSGMTVNASVICVDELKKNIKTKEEINALKIYPALRKKIPALFATTATTAAGAIPFLFLGEGANALIRTLSLVGALGVTCSFICSITVIPVIFIFKIQPQVILRRSYSCAAETACAVPLERGSKPDLGVKHD